MVDKWFEEKVSKTSSPNMVELSHDERRAFLDANTSVIIAGNSGSGKTTLMNELLTSFFKHDDRVIAARTNKDESKTEDLTFIVDHVNDHIVKSFVRMRTHVMAFDAPFKPDTSEGINFPKPSQGHTLFYVMNTDGDTAEEIKLNATKAYINLDAASKAQNRLVGITHIFTTNKEVVKGENIFTVTEHVITDTDKQIFFQQLIRIKKYE